MVSLANLVEVMKNDTTTSPLSPWDRLFPETSRRTVLRDMDLYSPGDSSDSVFLVEKGGIVEIRADGLGITHAVGLSGPGSLLGARLTTTAAVHAVRATALLDSVVRVMDRAGFLQSTLSEPELAAAYMHQLASRLETARHLSETCAAPTTGDHILGVLETVAATFGVSDDGSASIPIQETLLERMTGTPHRLLMAAVHELRLHGLVRIEKDAVRWVL